MGALTLEEVKQCSAHRNQTLHWALIAFAEEEILGHIFESSLKDNCIIKGDYIQFGECDGLAKGLPELELVLCGQKPEEILEIIKNGKSENVEILSIEEVTRTQEYAGEEIRYRVETACNNINTAFWMVIHHFQEGEEAELKESLYWAASSRRQKELRGLTDTRKLEFKRMYVEGIFVEKLWRVLVQGELIDNMKDYFDMLFIVENYCLDGRKIREYIQLPSAPIGNDVKRLEFLGDNINLMRRYKAYAREIKSKLNSFSELIKELLEVLEPIQNAITEDREFFGEWMPELKRYID